MNIKIYKLRKHSDKRGWLTELFRRDKMGIFMQVYCATLKKDAIRGNHYHKERMEWFSIIKGSAKLFLEDEKGNKKTILMSERDLKVVEIQPMIFHKIININKKEAILVSGISDLYDQDNPDTYQNYE